MTTPKEQKPTDDIRGWISRLEDDEERHAAHGDRRLQLSAIIAREALEGVLELPNDEGIAS